MLGKYVETLDKFSLIELQIVASNDKLFVHMFIQTEVFKWMKNIERHDKLIVHAPVL